MRSLVIGFTWIIGALITLISLTACGTFGGFEQVGTDAYGNSIYKTATNTSAVSKQQYKQLQNQEWERYKMQEYLADVKFRNAGGMPGSGPSVDLINYIARSVTMDSFHWKKKYNISMDHVKRLIEVDGADPNYCLNEGAQLNRNACRKSGPLVLAAKYLNQELVEFLLGKGAKR